MINPNFVFLGAAFSIIGAMSYARDTIRGVTKPNRVSWLLWTIAPLRAFAAKLRQGVGLQSVMAFAVGFSPFIILCASFRGADGEVGTAARLVDMSIHGSSWCRRSCAA